MRKSFALGIVACAALGACTTSSLTQQEQDLLDSSAASSAMLESSSEAMMESSDSMMMEGNVDFSAMTVNEEESVITFTGESTGNVISHEGKFNEFAVDITAGDDPTDLTMATIDVAIQADSIESDAGVTGHLMREDFFDVETYPTITFNSTAITMNEDGSYTIEGNMTVKGETKPVSATATMDGNIIRATMDFPRQEFGVGNDSYGDKLLRAEVPVAIALVLQ